MKVRILHRKRAVFAVLFTLLLSVAGVTNATAQSFTVGDLTYTFNDDGASVTLTGHVDGISGQLVIPESVELYGNSYAVTSISEYAFYECSALTGSLVIPNTVTFIGQLAFYHCYGLNGSLVLGNSVQTIAGSAFAYCNFIGELTIPESVSEIIYGAFYQCNFTTLSFNANNCYIEDGWLAECNSLTNLNLGANLTAIPDGLTSGCTTFTGSLIIPSSVSRIGDGAFNGCSGFTGTLVIPETVTYIGSSAFNGCSGFTGSLTIPNTVTNIGNSAFMNCSGFSGTLTLGQSLTEIGNSAFFGACENFTSFNVLAETPPTLGNYVFLSANTGIPVYVTCGTLEAYQNASGWNNFTNLQETNPCMWEIWVDIQPAEGGTVSASESSRSLDLYYDFEDGMQGWTAIDGGSPQGYGWQLASNAGLIGSGHNGSSNFMLSKSYDNGYGVIYPDNYLVSPQVTLGGSITFYACAEDPSYSAEHFGVAVSTGSNTNPSDFQMIQEWTMTAKGVGAPTEITRSGNRSQGNWYQYTVDLSGYNGMGYVAIRHFNCSDMYYLDVDDITITIVGDPIGSYLEGETCTLTATPNEDYAFVNWTEDGEEVSTEATYSFTVTGDRNLVAHFRYLKYEISAIATPEAGGTISGTGNYLEGETCTLTATPNGDYEFSRWTENGIEVSTDAVYSFTVEGNRDLVAHFTNPNFIVFADPDVEAICVNNWDTDGDGFLSYAEAAAVTDLGWVFEYNGNVNSFDELQYFTGLTSIRYESFYDCGNLTSITLPENITSIGSYAFGECYNLSSINVLAVTPPSAGYSSFSYLNIDNIIVSVPCNTMNDYQNADGWYRFTNYQEPEDCIYEIMATVNIEEAGTVSGAGSYQKGSICTLVATPNEGRSFVRWVENGQEVSTETTYSFIVTGPRNLVAAFMALEEDIIVFADDNVKAVCVNHWDTDGDGELTYDEAALITDLGRAFRNNSSITFFDELQYFTGLTYFGSEEFYRCSSLTSFVFPESLTTIGEHAFAYCSSLTGDLVIPNSVTSISGGAFLNCSGFDGELSIGESITYIDYYAFGNTNFYKVNFNATNCDYMCDNVFMACYSVITALTIGNNVERIPANAFRNFYNVADVLVIPDAVTYIGDQAFYNCYGFESIVMGNSVETIGNEAFQNCSGLRGELTLPETLTSVGTHAFASCDEITTINYNATNCNVMGNAQQTVFYDCISIQHINIGENVESIPNYAFKRCSNVADIHVDAMTPPTVGISAFATISHSVVPVYVPCGTSEAYQSAAGWSEFLNIQEDCSQMQTQTTTLSQGWNWFSTYIDGDPVELLTMLEESLGEHGILIESLSDGVNENLGDGFWMGDLDGVGVLTEQMYMIEVDAECTVELQGVATNPANHAITINPGQWNWIGFPCSEEVNLAVALSGFEAEEGDLIESLEGGIAEYLGDGLWMGFETMVPGRGYMYYSASNVPKTLVFQTGGTKAQ